MVEHLLCEYKTLNSNPSLTKKKRKKERKEERKEGRKGGRKREMERRVISWGHGGAGTVAAVVILVNELIPRGC
jgi:uncharacterized FAD-dependent dehydrogenase